MLKKFGILLLTVCLLAGGFGTAAQASTGNSLEQTVTKIVNQKVKKSDGGKSKLKKLFVYVQKNYDYGRKVGFKTYSGWEKDYAAEMFSAKKGSCYHYAAAYAFLAKKATGYSVRVGVGKTNGFSGKLQPHAWVEVKISSRWYICDPNMDKYAAGSSRKYFLKNRNGLKSTYNNFKDTKYVNVSF